jgi:hypothetical protein
MSAPPLSHHEILALAEPLARAGWRFDPAASHREEHRLRFVPAALSPAGDASAGGHVLDLDASRPRRLRLTRTLTHPLAGRASVRASGPDLSALVAAVHAIGAERLLPPAQPRVARHYTVEVPADGPTAEPVLVEASVRLDGLAVRVAVPDTRGVAAEVSLQATGPGTPAWPEDLLAVLGWDWSRLVVDGHGWTSRLRLRGDLAARTRRAEQAVEQVASHLETTLRESPSAYHARLHRARWGVFFRRGIPTFTAIGLAASALALAALRIDLTMAQWIALYHVPTLIVAVSFALQELPRFEIPPWPRPLEARTWFSG